MSRQPIRWIHRSVVASGMVAALLLLAGFYAVVDAGAERAINRRSSVFASSSAHGVPSKTAPRQVALVTDAVH